MPWKTATAILIMILSSSVTADIYSWTDANGVVHFTDTPPVGNHHQSIEIENPVTVPMAENLAQHRRISKIRKQVKGMLSTDRKQRSARTKARTKAVAKQDKTCAGYRAKLAKIQSKLRAGYSVDKGNSLRRKRRKVSRLLSWECILR